MNRKLSYVDKQLHKLLSTTMCGEDDTSQHVLTLFSIAAGMKARNILELGTRAGSTTLPLLLAAYLNDGSLTSVDIKETSFKAPAPCARHWSFIQDNAVNFLEAHDKSQVFDLVFIDDWHAYEHVKRELFLLDQCVSPRSVILLHDLMYGHYHPHYHCDLTLTEGQWAQGGPYRAVAELPPDLWEFATIPVCHGLTLLRKKFSTRYHS